jgi:hypothetical protein
MILFVQSVSGDRVRPVRGTINFSVFLCSYKDEGLPPNGVEYYDDLFFRRGLGGLADYWSDMSTNATGTMGIVSGWHSLSSTVAQAEARSRDENFNECVAKVKELTGYTAPSDDVVVVVTYPGIDLWGASGRVFAAWNHQLGDFQHETGHSIGLSHSFSNITSYCNAGWALKGEYGDRYVLIRYKTLDVPFAFALT